MYLGRKYTHPILTRGQAQDSLAGERTASHWQHREPYQHLGDCVNVCDAVLTWERSR